MTQRANHPKNPNDEEAQRACTKALDADFCIACGLATDDFYISLADCPCTATP